ncbi:pseudouridine synthase [Methylocystis echinoides]|uniref:pseudouridine synthase n=1 Tax=Methylocystis echinoides TaxID=29468 RepID=UPI003412E70F
MADKKSDKRSGAPGGDRPMRRRPSANDAPDRKAGGAPFGKPRAGAPKTGKDAKPGAAKRAKPAPAPVEKTSSFAGERIAKAMARAGVCSRRDAEDWIEQGRVAVNGRVLTSPAVNVTEADKIEIDGAPMQARERTRLFLFHKPQGYVTTAHDPEGRPTVFSYLEERHPELPRLVSVGRLDINTEGLLLLTNDGGLARTLELPATGWTRRYRVRVHGETDQAQLDDLRKGVTVEDVAYAPIEARLEREQGSNAWIAMALTEGKNREVKRVMEHLGLDVTRLIRVSYGPFQLGELAEGAVEEVKLKVLRDQLGKSLAALAGVDFASPLREPTAAEQQEQRERVEKRARKHVSVLRKQRDELAEKGPRARIERGATADRKGRAVAVERVTPTRTKRATEEEAPASRNARRFEALRGAGRPRRDAAEAAERPFRRPRDEGAARPERGQTEKRRPPRFEGERAERPARGGAERRAHGDAKAAPGHARARPPSGAERGRFERRPRQEGAEGRGTRGFASEGRAPRPPRQARDAGERPERFERTGVGRSDANRSGGERAPRPRARPPGGEERGRFERRPRQEGAEGRGTRGFASEGRAPRPPRQGRDAGERPERFERSGGGRNFDADRGGERAARPRARDAGTPEGSRRGPPRSASPKGPPKGRGGPGGAPRGLNKGPRKGPGKGPGGGPRKPRGA